MITTDDSGHDDVTTEDFNRFVVVCRGLDAIRAKRLYRATHETFEDYCRERWGLDADDVGEFLAIYHVLRDAGVCE